ncbi:hypothetical protein NDU88_005987 [Pleurodeles waltl]|uniref:Uncharacterized protein n=1 Tax=Pleurodeles waltl TaxID=8319 RepID=A0AAV7WW96_PLEWA|nr:hypothetical protein NDU88_005987 [Pleurodeles waltl]
MDTLQQLAHGINSAAAEQKHPTEVGPGIGTDDLIVYSGHSIVPGSLAIARVQGYICKASPRWPTEQHTSSIRDPDAPLILTVPQRVNRGPRPTAASRRCHLRGPARPRHPGTTNSVPGQHQQSPEIRWEG